MSVTTEHDGTGELNAAPPVALDAALRALPLATPPAGAWAEMAARLAAAAPTPSRRARMASVPRRSWVAGMAAAALLALGVTHLWHPTAPGRTGVATANLAPATQSDAAASSVYDAPKSTNSHDSNIDTNTALAALQARSRALEQWLHDTGHAALPQSPQDLAASAEIEDMIGLVDVQLGAADGADASASLSLWQRRVALLEDLSTLRYSANATQFQRGLATN